MEDKREALIDHFLEVGRQFMHRNLQIGGERQWAELDLTMSQLKVLFVLVSLGRATMSQIARGVGMTLSTATGVADRLVAQGLVRRVNDPDDRRLVWLHPTATATALVDRLIQVGERQLRLVARHLSVEDLSLVVRAQDLLCEAMLRVTSEELAAAEGEVETIASRTQQEQSTKSRATNRPRGLATAGRAETDVSNEVSR